MLQINSQIIMLLFIFLVVFIVIKYLVWRSSLILSNAQSLDTAVHQGSIENTTREPGTNAAIIP
jgi:F0F1-type ATP synthase membrane subunit b/b'